MQMLQSQQRAALPHLHLSRAVQPRLAAFVKADGNVKLVVKNFPVIGRGSRIAARAAHAQIAPSLSPRFAGVSLSFRY